MNALAYADGEFALLPTHDRAIIRLDHQLCPMEAIQTCHKYQNLCFDMEEQCFWATGVDCPSTLIMLDLYFNEIEIIPLSNTCSQRPCAISCQPCTNSILMLYSNTIVSVDKCSGNYEVLPTHHQQKNVDILALKDGYILAYKNDHHYFLEVNCDRCDQPHCYEIPNDYLFQAMYICSICENNDCITYEVIVLLCNRRSHEQSTLSLCISCCIDTHRPNPSCEKYEIMHSIALEEAGIAHILNAEGEKLQKAVASDITIEELLCVNDSVRRTIAQITLLEGQLYSKLDSLSCFCEEEMASPSQDEDLNGY